MVFLSDADRLYFLCVLHDVLVKTGARLLAYCLMGNHYHLLIRALEVSISEIMQRVLTRYAKHSNFVAEREGHVFQARFLAKLCHDDAYLIAALRYIHRNPVDANLCEGLSDWPWSSHRQFVGPIHSTALDIDTVLAKLGPTRAQALGRYAQLMEEPADLELPEFDVPVLRSGAPPAHSDRPSLELLGGEVFSRTSIEIRGLSGKVRTAAISRARSLFCEMAAQNGYGVSEIAGFLGLAPSSVHERIGEIWRFPA
ncbi:MAG: transposase [Elusimicrobia bacterium]|nr:transposase [Elusimicrobiota bacterium]